MKNMWRAAILAMCVCALAGCKKAEEKPGIETEAAGTQEEMTDLVRLPKNKKVRRQKRRKLRQMENTFSRKAIPGC